MSSFESLKPASTPEMRAGVQVEANMRGGLSDYELACRKLARYLPTDVFVEFMHNVNVLSKNAINQEQTNPMFIVKKVDHRQDYYVL